MPLSSKWRYEAKLESKGLFMTLLYRKWSKNTAYCAKCLNEYLSSDILIDYFQDFSKLLHKINELSVLTIPLSKLKWLLQNVSHFFDITPIMNVIT